MRSGRWSGGSSEWRRYPDAALCFGAHGDWDAVETSLSDDLVIHEAASLPFGGDYRGRDALRRLYGIVMGYWERPSVDVYSIVGDDTYVVALMNFTMTSKATGETFTQQMAEVSTLKDDLVIEMRIHYYDTAEVARQAGQPVAA